jgi:prepilin-type N-terminal cleavage/methylation domain-containing protein
MKKLTKGFKKNEGFTLMEIIIVIVILGILALIAVPRLIGFTTQAEKATDKEYAAVVARAAELYWASNEQPATIDITDIDTSTGDGLVEDWDDALQYYNNSEPDISISNGVATVTIYGDGESVSYTSPTGYTETVSGG